MKSELRPAVAPVATRNARQWPSICGTPDAPGRECVCTPGRPQVFMGDLIEALTQAEEYFANHSDVVDGDYGVPEPNKEMRLAQLCRDALEPRQKKIMPMDSQAADTPTDTRACSCYPGEGPTPCERKHALRECWQSAVWKETEANIAELKSRDRDSIEQFLLDYMMRVRAALFR
jgi:hypothetical protein